MTESGPIDPRHWINCGPLVTPERLAKGDLTVERRAAPTRRQEARGEPGDIRVAQVQVRNLLNLLHERGILDEQHVWDGQTFEQWRMWFTAELSCRPSRIYGPEMRGIRRELAEDDLAHDDYGKLIRGMSRRHLALIGRAVDTHATEHESWLACRDGHHFREAFDRLSVVMERLRAEFKARKEAKGR